LNKSTELIKCRRFVNKLFLQALLRVANFEQIHLMKKLVLLLATYFVTLAAFSQHYYTDILSNKESNINYQLLKQSNISLVKGISYEADNSVTENFSLQQQVSRDKRTIVTTSTSSANITTTTVSKYAGDRLKTTTDSLNGVANTTDYDYDASGNLVKITSKSIDPDHNGTTTEIHQWFYRKDGVPDHMLKIKNGTDTVTVEFSYDEKGNIAEERWIQKHRLINNYYYYYNDSSQLTDIVRYNSKAKKMLPDYIFEYKDGRVSQMMQTLAGSTNYLVWKYSYDEKGLKLKDVLYDKNKQVVGRVEYIYTR
jgi:YD repeat-containing protein